MATPPACLAARGRILARATQKDCTSIIVLPKTAVDEQVSCTGVLSDSA